MRQWMLARRDVEVLTTQKSLVSGWQSQDILATIVGASVKTQHAIDYPTNMHESLNLQVGLLTKITRQRDSY